MVKNFGLKRFDVWTLTLIALLFMLQLGSPSLPAAHAAPIQLYVSPSALNGAGDCSFASPCSLDDAPGIVRTMNQNMNSNIIVNLLGGTYVRTSTFTLGASDSGSNGYSVIYRNYQNDTPIVSGGKQIPSWTIDPARPGVYYADVGTDDFRQLYVGGQRAIRARAPNVTNLDTGEPYYTAITGSPFRVAASQIQNWASLNRVEVVKVDHFRQKRLRIDHVDYSGSQAKITFRSPESEDSILLDNYQGVQSFYFENALELLDAEGEWYLDKSVTPHRVYLKSAANPNTLHILAPRVETLVKFAGTAQAPVHHIELRGLQIAYSTWMKPDSTGYIDAQAALQLHSDNLSFIPASVMLANAHHIRLEGNTIRNTGAHGIYMEGVLNDNSVFGNTLTDLSAGGIYEQSFNSVRNTISSNTISKAGRAYTDAVGIMATQPERMSIEFNEISQAPYSGISIGWAWDDSPTGTDNNTIANNKIHDVVQLHDDGAGIYSLGAMQNTVFKGNYIYNIVPSAISGGMPVSGIYMDEGSSYKTMDGNVLSNTVQAFFFNNKDYTPAADETHDNTIKSNYYYGPLGTIGGTNNSQFNNQAVTISWPAGANDIMNGAGKLVNQALANCSIVANCTSASQSTGKSYPVDGNADESGWSGSPAGAGNPWWQVDLGSSYRIRKIEIVSRLGTVDQPATRRNFQVWVSDNANMSNGKTILATVGSGGYPHQSTWSLLVTDPTPYRYVAIVKSAAEDVYLNEVRVYR